MGIRLSSLARSRHPVRPRQRRRAAGAGPASPRPAASSVAAATPATPMPAVPRPAIGLRRWARADQRRRQHAHSVADAAPAQPLARAPHEGRACHRAEPCHHGQRSGRRPGRQAARRAVSHHQVARRGRHGSGLPGPGQRTGRGGGDQDGTQGTRCRSGHGAVARPAIQAGTPAGAQGHAQEHRPRARHRRTGRREVHHHAVPAGRRPGERPQARGQAAGGARAQARAFGDLGPGGRARRRRGAPRPEARQHHGGSRRRGAGDGFRRRPLHGGADRGERRTDQRRHALDAAGARRRTPTRADGQRHGGGHDRVHGARAVARRGRGSARRRLCLRVDPLRPAARTHARGTRQERDRGIAEPHARGAAPAAWDRPRHSPGRRADCHEVRATGSRRPVRNVA